MMDKKSEKPAAGKTPDSAQAPEQQPGTSRRDILKAGVGVAAGAAMGPALSFSVAAGGDHDDDDDHGHGGDTLNDLERANGDRNRVILLKGGTVITMDPAVPDLVKGDVLIKGKKIVAVGADLSSAARDRKCVVVNAKGTIVIPGMVDCHHHSWEGQIKNIIPSGVIADYNNTTHMGFGPFYRPQDMYAGNHLVMLDAIDAGTTCVIDHSHNSRTSAHSDAAIEAIFDSGIRAMHAVGAPQAGTWDMQLPNDLVRIKNKYFQSEDQLVTLSYRVGVNLAEVPLWQFGRNLGLWLTHDGGSNSAALFDFYNMGLLDERHNFSHGNNAPLANLQLLKDVGAHINYCVRSDTQYQLGFGIPVSLDNALAIGLRPGLSVDNVISYSGGVLAEMRAMFHVKRGYDQYRRSVLGQTPPVPPISVRDCLEFATIRGAGNAGLANKVGSLTPGKEADIVMIRADAMNTLPLNNAVGVVVNYAERHNVDAVFIAGKVKKWNGKLVGVNMAKVRKLAEESRQYLFAARGYTLNILS
jgi:cytosine/adenosine deaminase-related metal-dependent hydrolase